MTSSIFEQKLEYLWNERRYSKKDNAILVPFESTFQSAVLTQNSDRLNLHSKIGEYCAAAVQFS